MLKNLCVTKKFTKNNKINNIAQNIYKYYGYNPKKNIQNNIKQIFICIFLYKIK